jgi:hypothetical protein
MVLNLSFFSSSSERITLTLPISITNHLHFFARHALDVLPVSKVPKVCTDCYSCSRHFSLHLAYPHNILYACQLIRIMD